MLAVRPTTRREELGLAVLGAVALLATLGLTARLGIVGAAAGAATVAVTVLALTAGLRAAGRDELGPANRITLARAVLAAGVTALVADAFARHPERTAIVVLAALALVLDGVDGWVARRTRSVSDLGWHFDLEVDAYLILALSVLVAREHGWWVLLIGVARYAAWLAGRHARWLREPVPPRWWRKPVAAVQGIVLTGAVSGLLPGWLTVTALAAALALLTESFGRDVWWQWRLRRGDPLPITAGRAWARAAAGALGTTGAAALVWFALLAPDRVDLLDPAVFVRIPVEGLIGALVFVVLPRRWGASVAVAGGVALGALTVVRLLDMGFFAEFDRPFVPTEDAGYLAPGYGVLRDSVGSGWAAAVAAAAALTVVALLTAVPWSTLRLARIVRRRRRIAARAAMALSLVWLVGAALDLHDGAAPLASAGAASLAYDHVRDAQRAETARAEFARALQSPDPVGATPASGLLGGLRGKDVVVAFVESYGQVAVQGSAMATADDRALRHDTAALTADGFASRSAFLTSATFGGISWLAHSTFESGLWVDNQDKYDTLLGSHRATLASTFRRAGWRTVDDSPADTRDWPQGRRFYRYEQVYDERNVGYRGPTFGYATMPDQFTLQTFARRELTPGPRRPVMAEIDLVTSHTPWTPLPALVSPKAVGDGASYDRQAAAGPTTAQVWTSAARVRAAYAQSIRYSLASLVSFVRTAHDPNLVLILLGDHQPWTIVSGNGASHDVPISIVAPAGSDVVDRTSSWRWQPGLLPHPDAPVWRMDAFRDRFLDAFRSAGAGGPQAR